MKYQHLFFDLDNTLWDFEHSSVQTIAMIYSKYELKSLGIENFDEFNDTYFENNAILWELYRNNGITKSDLNISRFHNTLREFGINDMILAQKMANDYVSTSPYSGLLMPNAIELLTKLQDNYTLHIITNGFEELQRVKMETTSLDLYFNKIITSESVGYKKPDLAFFQYALEVSGATQANSLIIGDDYEADIVGAINAGIDHVFYNPQQRKHGQKVMYEINDLMELIDVLR